MDRVTIIRRLMRVALPILSSSLVGLLALFINTAIIGRNNTTNLYVLGILVPIGFLQISINESLRVSSIAFSSQAAGSGDMQILRRRLQSLLVLGVLIYLLLAFAFWLGHGLFISVYQVPAAQQTITYHFIQLNILIGALVVVSISMMSSLYGLGHVYSVTLVTVVGFVANILLTLLFASWGGWGLYALIGSSLIISATTIAWAASMLARHGALERLGYNWLRWCWEHWCEVHNISMPVFAGYLVLFAHITLFNRLLALFSPLEIAGFGVAYRIQNIVLMPAISIGIALAIHVNRMVAAQQQEQVYRFLSTAMWTSFVLFVGLAGVVFWGRDMLPSLVSSDHMVVSAASRYLAYIGPAYMVLGPLLTLLIFFEQTGNGIRSLLFNAGGFAVQLVLAFYLAWTYHSLDLVYQAVTFSYLGTVLYILYEMARSRRLLRREISLIRLR